MNTKWQLATAAVTGARHLRAARNGQDAVSAWLGDDAAAVVVCDGCGSGASSELGALLGARLVMGALARRLARGAAAGDEATWRGVRDEVAGELAQVLERLGGDRDEALGDALLFTIVAAAVTRDEVAVWALGDGAYALIGASPRVRVLGPFADNAPPYLAYDLVGDAREARLEVVSATSCTGVVVATDGASDLSEPLEGLAALMKPDALRRKLAVLARSDEQIDWDERRVVRTPAVLQDDCAVAALRWTVPS
jgi:hypothetical protein